MAKACLEKEDDERSIYTPNGMKEWELTRTYYRE